MTLTTPLTSAQERRFYREAVQASLERFYGKSKLEARQLVRGWWKRLTESGASDSGLFLHAEPINTAAGIAEVRVVPITAENRKAYHRILDQSRDLVLLPKSKAEQKTSKPTAAETERQKRLVYVATSATSGVVRRAAGKDLAKKTKNKKSAANQKVAFG
jgi:hypothetical protein